MIINKIPKGGLKALEAEFKKSAIYKTLNTKQKEFFSLFFSGENVLLTGPAGTGKSYCINALFNFLNEKKVFVGKTALTGVAALNIGGATIHSWAGLGIAEEDVDFIVKKAQGNKKAKDRIRGTSILFIDEISMASADLLDKLNAVLKAIRFSKEPFGGMQVVFSGDFLQLPPVMKGYGKKVMFAFDSEAWNEGAVETIELKKLVRQDETTAFAQLLQKVRFGDTDGLELLEDRIDAKFDGDIKPIKIFCKNIDINAYNDAEYRKINAPEQTYVAKDTGGEQYIKFFDRNCPAPAILKLKVGTQVMLLVNIDVEGGLVNGSMGVVTGFSAQGPIIRFTDGQVTTIDQNKWEYKEQEQGLDGKMKYRVVATRSQIPLKLAWATSVHKQQGCTLDRAKIDVSEAFDYGQVYVALSRVRSLEGLSLANFAPNRIKAHPECLKFYKGIKKKKTE